MRRIKRKIIIGCLTVLMLVLRVFPIKKNKVVFSNFVGKGFGGNPKYIYLALSKMAPIDAVWLVNDPKELNDLPDDIRAVKYHSLRKFYELATAKVWIDNCRKGEYMLKRKQQYYVMTWHGGLCMKKVEKDAADSLGEDYIKYAKTDASRIDLMVSNSSWCTKRYRESYWYTGEIIEEGIPRHDFLILNDKNWDVKKSLKIPVNNKVILYVPTFRKDNSTDAYTLEPDKIISALSDKFGGSWSFVYRLHPSVKTKFELSSNKYQVIDASTYNDLYELLTFTDVVITDYSSVIFDFAYNFKPGFIYASDLEEFKKDRSTYFDIQALPFPFSDNNQALVNRIMEFDKNTYCNALRVFFDEVGLNETGHASQSVANKVIEHMF